MNIDLIDGLIALTVVLLGWLHMRQNAMDVVIAAKADKSELKEVEDKVTDLHRDVIELKVGQERCLTILESLEKRSYEKD